MSVRRRMLRVVEAAYAPAVGLDAWAAQVSRALAGWMPGPIAPFAHVHRKEDGRMTIESVHAEGMSTQLSRILESMNASTSAKDAAKLWSRSAGVGTTSETIGHNWLATHPAWLEFSNHPSRCSDCLGMFFERNDGRTITFCLPLDEPRRLDARTRSSLVRVLTHLALAERLQREKREVAAVLGSDGEVLHAVGEARNVDARAALRAHARRIDLARSGGQSDQEGLALWRGMVDGQWSLVDEFDSDGKRFFIARENIGVLKGSRALSLREQQVLGLVCTGRSNKLVAYELGIAPSTVSLHLRSILEKTGAKRRADLIELADAVRP